MRTVWRGGFWLGLVTGLAHCADPPPPPAPPIDAGLVIRPELSLPWPRLLLPIASSTVPVNYHQAQYNWQTATTAFAIGAYDDAASNFMNAAEKLIVLRTHAQHPTFQAGRCMAYENAGAAMKGARDPKPTQQRLERMANGDPGCFASLRRILGKEDITPLGPVREPSETGTRSPANDEVQ